jgi:HSP20 family protein
MTLIRWEPRRELETAQRQFKKIFDAFENGIQNGIHFEMGAYVPRIDISEDEKNVYLVGEFAGMSENDVKLSITDGILTIRGEKKRKEEFSQHNFHRIERTYGEFVRQFTLPDNLNEDEIRAEFENGVLEVTIPKREPEKPKEREIRVGRKVSNN